PAQAAQEFRWEPGLYRRRPDGRNRMRPAEIGLPVPLTSSKKSVRSGGGLGTPAIPGAAWRVPVRLLQLPAFPARINPLPGISGQGITWYSPHQQRRRISARTVAQKCESGPIRLTTGAQTCSEHFRRFELRGFLVTFYVRNTTV